MKPTSSGGDGYFDSYDDLDVHRLMLNDKSRTEAYRMAIHNQRDFFKDKVVMDVGAGTGILSVFCAQAGAKKVFAVEASNLSQLIPVVADENKFSHIIEVFHSRVEDVCLPDDMKVDIIISEWMGFYLLHEGMLDSVIVARDRHLKNDGVMFPSSASLWVSACSVPSLFDFWEDVHGVSMRCIGMKERASRSNAPQVIEVSSENLLTEPTPLCNLDLMKVSSADLNTMSMRIVTPASRSGRYQGVCLWFNCDFPVCGSDSEAVVLSTSPSAPETHWKQTVIVLQQELEVEESDPIAWDLNLSRNAENNRHYDLQLEMLDPEKEKHPMPCGCHMTKCIVIRAFLSQAEDEPSSEDCSDDDDDDVDVKEEDEEDCKS